MTKLIALLTTTGLTFAASFYGMIYGWGLEVKSWRALILSWLCVLVFGVIAQIIAKEE